MQFLSRVASKYKIVAEPVTFRKALLAWEFDPDIFLHFLEKSLELFREAGLKYDLLHARPPGTPLNEKMVGQGFNLAPKGAGNDWPHISIGMFENLKLEEIPTIANYAASFKPSFKVIKFGSLDAVTTGLTYLVLDLWPNREQARFEKALKVRFQDNFITYADKGFPLRPHVSVLGFQPKDTTKVMLIVQKLNSLFQGKIVKPRALQLWQNYHIVKHIYLPKKQSNLKAA